MTLQALDEIEARADAAVRFRSKARLLTSEVSKEQRRIVLAHLAGAPE